MQGLPFARVVRLPAPHKDVEYQHAPVAQGGNRQHAEPVALGDTFSVIRGFREVPVPRPGASYLAAIPVVGCGLVDKARPGLVWERLGGHRREQFPRPGAERLDLISQVRLHILLAPFSLSASR